MGLSVPVSWLDDYVTTCDPNALAERLTLAGLEIESVEMIGEHWNENLFLVAEILEVLPHPNADQLSLVTVHYGTTSPLQVVCGAPNVRCYENKALPRPLKAALALPGAVLVEASRSPGLLELLRERILGPRRDEAVTMLRRGVDRSEVRPDIDLEAAVHAIVGSMFVRRLLGTPESEEWIRQTVEIVCRGVLADPNRRQPRAGHGEGRGSSGGPGQ